MCIANADSEAISSDNRVFDLLVVQVAKLHYVLDDARDKKTHEEAIVERQGEVTVPLLVDQVHHDVEEAPEEQAGVEDQCNDTQGYVESMGWLVSGHWYDHVCCVVRVLQEFEPV